MSLDGFIADEEGCVDWLCTEDGVESTGSWEEFSKTFDTIIMGWNTYHQVRFELSADDWVYKGYNVVAKNPLALPVGAVRIHM